MKFTPSFLLILLTFIFFSCASDLCEGVECGPGVCAEGICDCPDGFSGVNCEIEDLCFNVDCDNATCNSSTGECECDENYFGDNCEDLCVNGTYSNGVCECDEGFIGESCDTAIRARFVGDWEATFWEYSLGSFPDPGFLPAFINFAEGDDIFEVLLSTTDFALRISEDNNVVGQITETTITFELQDLISTDPDATIEGTATLENDVLRFQIRTWGSFPEFIFGTFTKI